MWRISLVRGETVIEMGRKTPRGGSDDKQIPD